MSVKDRKMKKVMKKFVVERGWTDLEAASKCRVWTSSDPCIRCQSLTSWQESKQNKLKSENSRGGLCEPMRRSCLVRVRCKWRQREREGQREGVCCGVLIGVKLKRFYLCTVIRVGLSRGQANKNPISIQPGASQSQKAI